MICLAGVVQAHVVSQIFGEWKESETWEIEVLFDAGYAVPAWRGDGEVEAPGREWLVALGETGWAPLRHEAERYLRECLQLKSDGREVAWMVDFPDFRNDPPAFPELLNGGAYFRVRVIGKDRLDPGASLRWAEGNRPSLILKVPRKEAGFLTIKPGEMRTAPLSGAGNDSGGRAAWVEAFQQGFLHVLPMGLDHVLFVMGLFFYQRKWRPLLWQSLAFTLAHTATLGLAAAGWVRVSGGWVEPLIALSLVVIAVENLRFKGAGEDRIRLGVVFGFGLIHGLGFAGALAAWLKPGEGFLTALLSANLGVEAAQVSLLMAAWCLTWRWHDGVGYRRVRGIGCIGIAAVGAFWFLERSGALAIFRM